MDLEQEIKREKQVEEKLKEDLDKKDFKNKLSQMSTLDEAVSLASSVSDEGHPEYSSYRRLGIFLETLRVPTFASTSEKIAYIEFFKKVRQEFPSQVSSKLAEDFQNSQANSPF